MSEDGKQIDKTTLVNLFKSDMAASRSAAEERGAIGNRIRNLSESHNLDKKAYGLAKTLAKMPDGKREKVFAAFLLYCDYLEVNKQGDLFTNQERATRNPTAQEAELDAMGEGEPAGTTGGAGDASAEAEGESEGEADRVDAGAIGQHHKPGSAAGKRALTAFMSGMKDCATTEAVKKGLDRFVNDQPLLAKAAGDIAASRLSEINREDGGGEDLRPDALRKADEVEAGQIASDAKKVQRQRRQAERAQAAIH